MSYEVDVKLLQDLFKKFFAQHATEGLKRSWIMQERDERRRRMDYVLRSAAELKRLRDSGVSFCSMWAELAIEAIITGDTDALKSWGVDGLAEKEFIKNVGPVNGPTYAKAYAQFREICEEALITAKPRERV